MDDFPTRPHTNDTADPHEDAHKHHIVLTDSSVNKEEERERRKAQRSRKLRKAPPWIEAACAILLVVITGFYTFYAARQANASKKAAKAAYDAAVIAQNTLAEIQKGGTDTHELAVQAKNQADRTKDLTERAGKQATASQQAANAATSAAVTAKEALQLSERAYVANGPMALDEDKKTVKFALVNSGRVPSGIAATIIHEATGERQNPFMQEAYLQSAECHWMRSRVDSVAVGSPWEITVTTPKLDKDKMKSAFQQVVVAGYIDYIDGFPDTPMRESPFCIVFSYKNGGQTSTLIQAPCDSAFNIPRMEKCDKYPANETK